MRRKYILLAVLLLSLLITVGIVVDVQDGNRIIISKEPLDVPIKNDIINAKV